MTRFNRLARHARDPNIANGYETFSGSQDWWQDDRATEALRAVPAPQITVDEPNYYMDLLERMGLVRRLDGTRATPEEVAADAAERRARVAKGTADV